MPEDQQSSVLIEATEEDDAKRKNLSRNLTAWKRPKKFSQFWENRSPTHSHVNKTRLALHPPIGIGLFPQLFFDVFTSKAEICRPTLVLPHFGHLIFLAFRSYSMTE
jgi:hypothetical protein